MSSRSTQRALAEYVNSASDFAESVKKDVTKDRVISDATILLLNKFIIAANVIKEMTEQLNKQVRKFNN